MPRIVPSQVVAFIDAIPLPPDEGFTTQTYSIDTADISGLADLIDQIPEELLTMDISSYASFICSKARIRETVLVWTARSDNTLEPSRFLMPPSRMRLGEFGAHLHNALTSPLHQPPPNSSSSVTWTCGQICATISELSQEPCPTANGRQPQFYPALRSKPCSCCHLTSDHQLTLQSLPLLL